ncbi:hypothetical protein J1N35_037077 [Gossypium stocksii]|uniref:Reverse transcriptase zinc-binding domain-containing protein n=1 Tax=Gossypium stocksii TaxID=47602 RepID=A0A9D3ZLA7_9ROSI|nr:hypothetical protein J1N35_037077 [Gossypium stocksii]
MFQRSSETNCLRASDGTHIKVLGPFEEKSRYRTRKNEITTNVLGVCDTDMQFTCVLLGWEGLVANDRVLRDVLNRRNGLKCNLVMMIMRLHVTTMLTVALEKGEVDITRIDVGYEMDLKENGQLRSLSLSRGQIKRARKAEKTFSVVRQKQSDHDAILFDSCDRKPSSNPIDNRLRFHYEECWAKENDGKRIINNTWNGEASNYGNKLDRVCEFLGPWQRNKQWKMKRDIHRLEETINIIIDSSNRGDSIKRLKKARCKLDYMYAREEKYWAQRSRTQWLKEGDRNTKYFHAKATGRLKKNRIEKLKDGHGSTTGLKDHFYMEAKRDRDIGIRDMRLFNIALLGRQVWRLINNNDSLCFKVLSCKYFLDVDNWGTEDLNGGTINSNMSNSEANTVRDLWVKNERKWVIDKVHLIYRKDWGDRICNLPIGNEDQGDRIVWFHNPHGCYTSKSAYSWLLLKEMGFNLHRCGAMNETLLHALRYCATSREVLSLGGWDMSVMMKQYDCCVNWLENMMRILDKRAMTNLFTTLWNCWNSRNNFIFKGKEDNA